MWTLNIIINPSWNASYTIFSAYPNQSLYDRLPHPTAWGMLGAFSDSTASSKSFNYAFLMKLCSSLIQWFLLESRKESESRRLMGPYLLISLSWGWHMKGWLGSKSERMMFYLCQLQYFPQIHGFPKAISELEKVSFYYSTVLVQEHRKTTVLIIFLKILCYFEKLWRFMKKMEFVLVKKEFDSCNSI